MNLVSERAKYNDAINKMVNEACHGKDEFIQGRPWGPKPKFFIVGDEPTPNDYITKIPFSGPLSDVLIRTIDTLRPNYPDIEKSDVYTTYLVKTTFRPDELTEKAVVEEWLPILQLEYYLSGCDLVVAPGRIARQFAGVIAVRPSFVEAYRPSILEKVKQIWRIAST
jgi:uracil-DNA glycosylase